jgi:hypothetical protein
MDIYGEAATADMALAHGKIVGLAKRQGKRQEILLT